MRRDWRRMRLLSDRRAITKSWSGIPECMLHDVPGAQLALYEQQLPDWTCHPSAKTQGGKQKMQEISEPTLRRLNRPISKSTRSL